MESDSSNLGILLDVCSGDKTVSDWLISQGYDVKRVALVDGSMPDTEVLALARSENRLLITYDNDFETLDYLAKENSYRNVLIIRRMGSAKSGTRLAVIKHIFDVYGHDMFGNFSTYRAGKLAVR